MRWSEIERFAPLTGVVFAVLFGVGGLLSSNLEYLASPADQQEFFTDHATRVTIGGYLGVLSAFFLVWFAGSVRDSLRPHEGGSGRLSAVGFGGGIAAATLVTLAAGIAEVAAQRADSDSGISADSAAALADLSGVIGGVALPVAMAVMIAASAVLVLRTRAWPTWLGWASVVVALGSLSPISYIFIGIDLLWVVVVSILLVMRSTPEQAAATVDS